MVEDDLFARLEAEMEALIEKQWAEFLVDVEKTHGPGKMVSVNDPKSIKALFVMGFCRGFLSGQIKAKKGAK